MERADAITPAAASGRSSRTSFTRSSVSTWSISAVHLVGAEHGHDEVARLADDLVLAHRIFRRAAHGVVGLLEHGAVGERDLDHGDTARQHAFERFLGDDAHLAALRLNGRLVHARLVVGGLERHRAVEEEHRDEILQAEVGAHDVVDLGGGARREVHGDLFDVVRLERMLLAQIDHRVERRLDRAAGAPFLDDGLGDLVTLAELVDEGRGIGLRRIGLEEVLVAGEDVVDSGPSGLDQQGRGDAVARRRGAEHEGLLGVLGVALPGAEAGARLLRGIVEQPAHPLLVEAGDRARRRRGTEGADDIVGVAQHVVAVDGFHRPHADVVAERHRAHEMRPVDAEELAHGERGRHDGAAGMRAAGAVIVVGLVGLGEGAVHDRRLERAGKHVGRDDGHLRLAAIGAGKGERVLPGRQLGARDHRRQRIEDVVLRLPRRLVRQRALGSLRHVGAQFPHHRTDVVRRARSAGKHTGGRKAAENRAPRQFPARVR